MTAVMLLGLGLIGLAAGSGWMTDVHPAIESDPGRAVALQAAVEEVVAMDFDAVAPGVRRYGGFEVTRTLLERTSDTVLVRFIVVDVARQQAEVESGPGSDPIADTLEYRRARP